MNVLKLAAFSHNGKGRNPVGVMLYDEMPSDEEMLKIAKK
jgi:predicted PhzF superfamily epimerase YddE/YHI9